MRNVRPMHDAKQSGLEKWEREIEEWVSKKDSK